MRPGREEIEGYVLRTLQELPREVFEPEALKQKPVTAGPAAERAPEAPQRAVLAGFGKEEEAAVMKRLQELGYVE